MFTLCYSDIPNHFADTKTDIQLSFQFSTKYLTLDISKFKFQNRPKQKKGSVTAEPKMLANIIAESKPCIQH